MLLIFSVENPGKKTVLFDIECLFEFDGLQIYPGILREDALKTHRITV